VKSLLKRKPLTRKQIRKLKNNADLVAKEAKFMQEGWIALPENNAFTLKTDVKFFKAMSEVINTLPEVFEQLNPSEGYMLAHSLLTDASSYVASIIGRRFSYTHPFRLNHGGLWIHPWYQQLYSVEELTDMVNSDIVNTIQLNNIDNKEE
tara:strand:- start:1178 stop:1627 length:450 start_codon:yes stop_codon:yes gene_type:complete